MGWVTTPLQLEHFLQVGAVIVKRDTVLGKGYNRMPKGCEELPWSDDEKEPLDSKYPYGKHTHTHTHTHMTNILLLLTVFHGAKAAIKDAFENKVDIKGATMYTTLFPANTEAQWITDLGIKELVYRDNTYKHSRFAKAAKRIFETSGVKFR